MDDLIKKFFYLTDIVDKIDSLIAEAGRTRSKNEKRALLNQAQSLADAYDKHTERKNFNQIA